jgi:hypothetical protein
MVHFMYLKVMYYVCVHHLEIGQAHFFFIFYVQVTQEQERKEY